MKTSTIALLLLYGCLSAARLLYLPHAVPVLDDWATLQYFEQAREGGVTGIANYLQALVQNTYQGHLRIFWASFVPVFGLFFVAGAAGWPYCLLAWAAHLLSALLLCRITARIADNAEAGFLAGAIFAAFPACNNVMFWSLATAFHYLQVLAFAAWFWRTWRKLDRQDFRYRWTDLAWLVAVAFTGEQVLPLLLLWIPLVWWLAGPPQERSAFARYWLKHSAALLLLLACYVLLINIQPIAWSLAQRYDTVPRWTLQPLHAQLSGALGLVPAFAGWRPSWGIDLALFGPVLLAWAALAWGWRMIPKPALSARSGELLLCSVAGVILAYLPLARLASPAPRHLYVLSFFLVPAGVAVLTLLPRRPRRALAALAITWGVAYTSAEIRQCWIPQSRVARAALDALARSGPFGSPEVVVLSGGPLSVGPAPAFVNGASWSLRGVLSRYTQAGRVVGGRDVVVGEQGELALYRGDDYLPFRREDFSRTRVLALGPDGRFTPRSIAAEPGPDGRYTLLQLRSSAAPDPLPAGPQTFGELNALPYFDQIYFVSRTASADLAARLGREP